MNWQIARRISSGACRFHWSSNGGVANALLNIERHHLGLDYYHRYPDLVNEVTREDVLTTARKFIDVNRLAIAVAGAIRK